MFAGETFDEAKDGKRLRSQLDRVRALMIDGEWRTLGDISMRCGGSEASVSARLRDLRKATMGLHQVERRRLGRGLWQYRVLPPAVVPPRDPLRFPAEEIAHDIVCDLFANKLRA